MSNPTSKLEEFFTFLDQHRGDPLEGELLDEIVRHFAASRSEAYDIGQNRGVAAGIAATEREQNRRWI